ncbi:uncharacterized protein [Rutidosis leptorrhynchoides]|uniref:uncharacterized protein n=1 Tax=Rutidosis leptorrhynchoides TaxID=125765 RepID=UPI003A99FCC3
MVKKLHDVHTCSRTQIMGNNKHATKKVLGSILMDSFKAANREYKPKDIRDDVANRFRVSVSYNQAWRAKCQAIEMLRGSSDDSFRMLPIYLHNLKIHNPGTITNLVTDKENKFVMCYMSIGVVIRSFVQHVRPIIIVDAAHLKGGYLGTNLVAVAMDGNNGILPLAYGIGEGETNSVWSWFFGNLRDHLMSYGMVDHMSEITFISDRAASIAHGIANVFPEAFHAHCARHLFMNIKTKSNKMKFFEWHFWKMVKAYRASDFHDHLDVFRRRLKASYKVLCEDGINRWSRSQSTHIRRKDARRTLRLLNKKAQRRKNHLAPASKYEAQGRKKDLASTAITGRKVARSDYTPLRLQKYSYGPVHSLQHLQFYTQIT